MKVLRKILSIATTAVFTLTLTAAPAQASIILFQDDTFQDVMSDSLRLGSNDAGASNTSIQFGNDGTGSENGTINWNITTNTFEFDNAVDVTGTVTADGVTSTGTANFSGTDEFRIREVANEAAATCTTTGELVMDTGENQLYICTATGEPGTWASTSGAADNFETVLGADGDNTLTTSDEDFNIATGTGEFDVTSTGLIDFNSATFTLNTSGNLDITGGGDITLTSTGSLAISTNAWDITAGGAASGFTTIGASGNITTSGGTFVVGTTALNETTAANDSGAFLIGVNDELANSDSANVQDVLDDLDAVLTTNAGNISTNASAISSNDTDISNLQAVTGSNAPNNGILSFYPEYPNSVLFNDGSNNQGTMSLLYDDTNDEHYYDWTSNQGTTQDMDIKFRFSLPADFTSFTTSNAFQYRYRTGTTTEADNDVEVSIYNATDETTGDPTLCEADTTNVSTSWATGTIDDSAINDDCTGATALDAGDVIEVVVKLLDNSGAGDFANIGRLIVNYDN